MGGPAKEAVPTQDVLTSDPQRPVATTLMRTCLEVWSFGSDLFSKEKVLEGLRTKD